VTRTYLALGRRSSTATVTPGRRPSAVSATPEWGDTQLKTSVQIDGKGVYLPRCSLRYAKSKPEAIAYGGGLSNILGGEERGRSEWKKVHRGL
jgi:hypothetical protein